MGENSSDEIVLTRRQDLCDGDSSDVVMVASMERAPRKTKSTKKRTNGGRKRRAKVEEHLESPKRLKTEMRVDVEDKYRVRVVEGGGEKVLYLGKTDTLEKIHQEFCKNDPQIKMRYRSTFVSKYLTLHEIGFNEEDDCITIHGPNVEDTSSIRLKINIDVARTVELSLDGTLPNGEILNRLEKEGIHGNLLIRNGIVVDLSQSIKGSLNSGDVIDVVTRDEIPA